ncbi:MAG: hypothetical protein HW394_1985 [Acidobacteria bacterium]|nr:hypothetical protein [Acidobacteriota bacterium]
MSVRRLALVLPTATILVLLALLVLSATALVGQETQTYTPPKTPWGEPDLQGIWSGETLTPVERPAKFANKPVLTPEEADAIEKDVASRPGRDDRSAAGTEKDVAQAYNNHWLAPARRLADRRTSLVVDPADGKVPAMTPEARVRVSAMREYLEALLQGTSGGKPGPISPRRKEPPPFYNVARMNRSDGPEDRQTTERCFGATMPNLGAVYRIVQSPGAVGMYHDSGQGQGFVRTIPVDGAPHLPSRIRLLHGDSRGRWDGNTLVIDTTNFTQKMDFRGSRQNLHLVERLTRASDNRITYRVTVEDPTTWTRPWTLEVPWERQPDKLNQAYESTCHEGNYGLLGMLANTRAAERLFREGKGQNPELQDNATGGGGDASIDR